jgi:hypothetical protein
LFLAGTGRIALEPSTASAKQFRSIDLAALGLIPEDLEGVGLEWYGVDDGLFQSASEVAASIARQEGYSAKEAAEAGEELGLQRSYTLPLYLPIAGGGSEGVETAGIWFTILEFDTVAHAGAMFDMTEDDLRAGDRQIVAGTHTIGDDSVLSRSAPAEDETGAAVADLTLEFSSSNYYVVVNAFDVARSGEFAAAARPAVSVVEGLGDLLLDRVVSAGGTMLPVLGTQVLRMTAEDGSIVTVADRYDAIDGIPHRRYAESDDALAARADQMERDRLVATYVVEQRVASGEPTVPGDPRLTVRLFEFEGDAAASVWLEETAVDGYAQEANVTAIEPIQLPFEFGDGSLGASYDAVFDGVEVTGQVTWIQVGDVVARISLDGAGPIGLDVIETLVEAQVDCLLGRPCGSVELPSGLD